MTRATASKRQSNHRKIARTRARDETTTRDDGLLRLNLALVVCGAPFLFRQASRPLGLHVDGVNRRGVVVAVRFSPDKTCLQPRSSADFCRRDWTRFNASAGICKRKKKQEDAFLRSALAC